MIGVLRGEGVIDLMVRSEAPRSCRGFLPYFRFPCAVSASSRFVRFPFSVFRFFAPFPLPPFCFPLLWCEPFQRFLEVGGPGRSHSLRAAGAGMHESQAVRME